MSPTIPRGKGRPEPSKITEEIRPLGGDPDYHRMHLEFRVQLSTGAIYEEAVCDDCGQRALYVRRALPGFHVPAKEEK